MNVLPRKPKIIWFDFSLPEMYQNLLDTRVTLSRKQIPSNSIK